MAGRKFASDESLKVLCLKASSQRSKDTIMTEEDAHAIWDGYEFSVDDIPQEEENV